MKVALLSMPFARLDFPSLALEQLKTLLRRRLGSRHTVELLYLQHDFLELIDVETYKHLAGTSVYINHSRQTESSPAGAMERAMKRGRLSGVGEWLFRPFAYPDSPDNTREFLARYFRKHPDAAAQLLAIRKKLPGFLDSLVGRHALAEYDVLAFTSMFEQHNPNLALIQSIRRVHPNALILLGGNNYHDGAEVFARHCPGVDILLSGPGYRAAVEAIAAFAENRRRPQTTLLLSSEEEDIDRAIDLDYGDFYRSFAQRRELKSMCPIVFFETSRGCWWGERSQCTFCDYNKRIEFRAMEPERAVSYLQRILDQGRGRGGYFWSVDSILPTDYIDRVFPRLSIPDDARIFYEVRACLSGAQLDALRRYHVTMVQCGIEALDTPTLSLLKKGMTGPGNLRFLRDSCQSGISVLWNLLCGIPGEEVGRLYQLLELIPKLRHLYPPTGLWGISYDRNGDYVRRRELYGLPLSPLTEFLEYAFPFDMDELNQIAYFYQNDRIQEVMTREKIKLIQKINGEIVRWQESWKTDDGHRLPRLYLADRKDRRLIDTRGEASEYQISKPALALLDSLQAPRPDTALRARFSSGELETAWQECMRHGLIWREEATCLTVSLVTMGRPALPKPFSTLDSWVWE